MYLHIKACNYMPIRFDAKLPIGAPPPTSNYMPLTCHLHATYIPITCTYMHLQPSSAAKHSYMVAAFNSV